MYRIAIPILALALGLFIVARPGKVEHPQDRAVMIKGSWLVVAAQVDHQRVKDHEVMQWRWFWQFDDHPELVSWQGQAPESVRPLDLSSPFRYVFQSNSQRATYNSPREIDFRNTQYPQLTFEAIYGFDEDRSRLYLSYPLGVNSPRPERFNMQSGSNVTLILEHQP